MGEGKGEELVKIEFKAYMHCNECGKEVEKYVTKIEGVQRVEADVEKSRLKVVGRVDSERIQKKLEKKIKRLELLSLSKEKAKVEEKKIVLKLQIHCEKCDEDLKEELMKLKDVYRVKTDFKAQTCTIEGTMEQEKIIEFLHKKFKKHAEVVVQKVEKKKEEEKKKEGEKKVEIKAEKKEVTVEKKVEIKAEQKAPAPYVVQCVYAPQTFSDENPEACHVM
ncbi:heavy metal-associated isoprenylated plant protein 4-like [Nymphaea colorata]|nr:heavy metal-associated isoprenylated plant protein 4-like [Nymphaea colorata]